MNPTDNFDLSFKNGDFGHLSFDDYYSTRLRNLMPYRIQKILLIASLYDTYLLEEDGMLADILSQSYKQRDLGYIPTITQTQNSESALTLLKTEKFDLVVCIVRSGDTDPFKIGRDVKTAQPGIPYILLSYDTPDLLKIQSLDDGSIIDKIFLWRGDGKILTGIIQLVEDLKNSENDTKKMGVPNILLVEDNIHFYSTYIHFLFETLWDQTNRLLNDNLTYSQRLLRQKSRPRIHLVSDFEKAILYYDQYKDHLLGVFTDLSYPIKGKISPEAGIKFIRYIRQIDPYIPIVVESSEPNMEHLQQKYSVGILYKNSPSLVDDLKKQLLESFGFGDLVFFDEKHNESTRISNLNSLVSVIDSLPSEALQVFYQQGLLRRWLLARTELELAKVITDKKELISLSPDKTREKFSEILLNYQIQRYKGNVVYYNRQFNPNQWHFCKIGSGSMGGKARGLAFIDKVLNLHLNSGLFPGVSISIPRTLTIGTDYFDRFMTKNNLYQKIQNESSDLRVANLFLESDLPTPMLGDLRDFIRQVKNPLAVRSSSLLEDALYHPFAGIYITKMLPNNDVSDDTRFNSLCNAIKLVYASTYYQQAKGYIESINHRIDEEKMGVVIQEVVGSQKNTRFYPEISGVARSYNYYPFGLSEPEDGVVNAALGLGKSIVDGGVSLQFCPKYPKVLPQLGTIKDMLNHTQRFFYAINLQATNFFSYAEEDEFLSSNTLEIAEGDGILDPICSSYSPENDRVYDTLSNPGTRIVTFAGILKHDYFPLVKIVSHLLKLSERAMGCPVEIEFAVSLNQNNNKPIEFGFLQVRPMVATNELVRVDLTKETNENLVCFSNSVLGNGQIDNIQHTIFVKPKTFDPSLTKTIAQEIGVLNQYLKEKNEKYILIGPGRWGSSDSWLGIPVQWDQISFAKTIIEVTLPNMNVDPSQGSHFFQNITSLRIAYFTIPNDTKKGFLDWEWLEKQTCVKETDHLKLVKVNKPFLVKMDGRSGQGLILKPEFREEKRICQSQ